APSSASSVLPSPTARSAAAPLTFGQEKISGPPEAWRPTPPADRRQNRVAAWGEARDERARPWPEGRRRARRRTSRGRGGRADAPPADRTRAPLAYRSARSASIACFSASHQRRQRAARDSRTRGLAKGL